jgi:hypothetical protein
MIAVKTPPQTQVRVRDSGTIVTTMATPTQYAEGVFGVSVKWPEGAYGYLPITQLEHT